MSVVTVRKEGKVSIIAINRPEKMNAINTPVALALQEAFEEFDASDQRVAILTSEGDRAFCAGADLHDIPDFWRCAPGLGIRTKKPIIAAVTGWCVGGGLVMAAMSDLCVATESTRFSYPEAKLGFTGGIVATLASRIPTKLAMEIMLMAEPVPGRRAYEMGLVNRIVEDGQHIEVALEMAQSMAAMAPMVLATLKTHVLDGTITTCPAERMWQARVEFDRINASDDKNEGLAASREKRMPEFSGQ
ncbi:enoyl-CoA hydratase/isomerase family protein [Roseovarius sp. SK2]|uniref:enoyl-CoA hydratase/isomerase family protein n=1 Tax=Roseovarius TaxID=74030 RepID=UPI00237B525E|nr:enoyl-CoA hydratase/isomerase family protein [Roseovarius sp. SK2]MDD9726936.1 enoyl-CoA hydratase/isomerase family protein [Roseovarius sp. SK2]